MTQPVPAAITSDGNVKVFYTPTIADPLNPTVAECTSDSGFDASCYLTDDGWAPATTENSVTDPRLCSRQIFEDNGTFTDQLVVKYIYRAQDQIASDNKPYLTWQRLTSGFLVVRWGVAYEADMAAADVVDVYQVNFGVQQKQPSASNEKLKIQQTVYCTGPVQRDVTVVS
jgi:hypothetical protein